MLNWVEHNNRFITSGPDGKLYYIVFNINQIVSIENISSCTVKKTPTYISSYKNMERQ